MGSPAAVEALVNLLVIMGDKDKGVEAQAKVVMAGMGKKK